MVEITVTDEQNRSSYEDEIRSAQFLEWEKNSEYYCIDIFSLFSVHITWQLYIYIYNT